MTIRCVAIATLLVVGTVSAQAPIRDNSFLVEEAYNQEGRVVQHISVLSLARRSSDWEYGFTQEWPAGGQRHQLSVTVPIVNAADATGVGDIALNYRYQLAFDDATGNALAPRLSVILPTGDAEHGRGTSSLGLQVNLPASWGVHRALVGTRAIWGPHGYARSRGGGERDLARDPRSKRHAGSCLGARGARGCGRYPRRRGIRLALTRAACRD